MELDVRSSAKSSKHVFLSLINDDGLVEGVLLKRQNDTMSVHKVDRHGLLW